nr:MAG TPA: hypothetical protein [Caudoviricetes sp.]
MVAQQILVLFVKVRVLMRQLKGAHCAPFFYARFPSLKGEIRSYRRGRYTVCWAAPSLCSK